VKDRFLYMAMVIYAPMMLVRVFHIDIDHVPVRPYGLSLGFVMGILIATVWLWQKPADTRVPFD
jgi:hypothetical protein